MWYFQISNDSGSIVYSNGISLNSSPPSISKNMLHTMNVAVKHSYNEDCVSIGEKVVSAQKVYIYNEESLYFNGAFEISALGCSNIKEVIIRGVFDSVYYCLVMLMGYNGIYGKREEGELKKAIKVLIYFIFFIKEAFFLV